MLVGAYALRSRMHVLSSSDIVDRAAAGLRTIVDIYLRQARPWPELPAEITGGKLDLLRDFSGAARESSCRHSSIQVPRATLIVLPVSDAIRKSLAGFANIYSRSSAQACIAQ
jgi:hypothetical protein